jgi:uncharacterized protein (TIGR00251 family)
MTASAPGPDRSKLRWIRIGPRSVTVEIRARPGAGRSAVLGADQRGLAIAIGAPPEKGKANDELVRMLAKLTGVARSEVSVVRGKTARNKSVRFSTNDPCAVAAKLVAIGSPK